ncbi:MAG: hypothetical protein J6332_07285 [Abditibacteriota bacterium]|nr:hypothetical protein [Abditibacteriota bacterium]
MDRLALGQHQTGDVAFDSDIRSGDIFVSATLVTIAAGVFLLAPRQNSECSK